MQKSPDPDHDPTCPYQLAFSPNVCDCGASEHLFRGVRKVLLDAGMIREDERRPDSAEPVTDDPSGQGS